VPLYTYYGVRYAWVIDPVKQVLEVYRLDIGTWVEIGHFAGADQVRELPFEAVSIDLKSLWLPQQLRFVEP